MNDQPLITTIDSRGVARLTLNRPEIRNAMNEAMIEAICDAMGRFHCDQNVRAVVFTGAGTAFSAGADLNMMKRAAHASASENKDDARRLGHMLAAIARSPKPTVALVNGPALAGGMGIVSACDIAIAADTAFFALSEVKLGLIPAVISPFVIQAIGIRNARRYFLTAERFDAAKAKEIGLVHEIAPADALNDALEEIVGNLIVGGPKAMAAAKDLIAAVSGRRIDDAVICDAAGRIAAARASDEGKEGIASFLEKRKPNWVSEG